VFREPSHAVSELLIKWRAGDAEALQALIPIVYADLQAIAHRYLRRERPNHTLQTMELVHEAYLRLCDQKPFQAENRSHFVGIAARLMRQILVDYARGRGAAKRGKDCTIALDAVAAVPECRSVDVVAVDDALRDLERIDEQQSRLVELRFFGGLTTEEAAEALGISRSTAKRDWNVAKAWLSRQMKRAANPAAACGDASLSPARTRAQAPARAPRRAADR
jgi:RNA polymerase sigma factor (TIGR02999 family)